MLGIILNPNCFKIIQTVLEPSGHNNTVQVITHTTCVCVCVCVCGVRAHSECRREDGLLCGVQWSELTGIKQH